MNALPTYNNLSKYWSCLEDLINLAKTRYNNLGLNSDKEYVWIQKLNIPDDLYVKYKNDYPKGFLRK